MIQLESFIPHDKMLRSLVSAFHSSIFASHVHGRIRPAWD